MAETQFTQGPWYATYSTVHADERSVHICQCVPTAEGESNAHLIAAAPDLYAVLDEINTWCGTDEGAHYLPFEPPWYTNLRAALAKARGEQ